ncbi:calpastatin isoform X3 [Alligator mississippiensis]|uniref:calpastatin isoform X3 n=1 Tax=Alligator mississippiensis TaxID=8496 RepID=UPI0028776A5E|nr:calpastatin isoform X3 [Alligator mississippiensis]
MAFARWWYATHGDKKKSGTSSRPGDKKGSEAAEKKPASVGVSQTPKTQKSGVAATTKTQPSSADVSKASTAKPSEVKATASYKQTSGQQSHGRKRNKTKPAQTAKMDPEKIPQSAKPDDSQTKHPTKEKQKESGGAKSPGKSSVATGSKQTTMGRAATGPTNQPAQATSIEESKHKTENKSLAGGAAAATAGAVGAVAAAGLVAPDKPSAESKESKPAAPTAEAATTVSSEKSDIDAALDSLIDTLGGPEENAPPCPVYTGPEVTDPFSAEYLEELGKREGSLPPEYLKLLEGKGDGKAAIPPKIEEESLKPMTADDIADALSSDFTCSVPSAEEKVTTLKEKPTEGEIVQAEATSSVRSSAPPKEKKPKAREAAISDDALEALADTLGASEPEPEQDLSSIVEVAEPKAKEKKEEKVGEREDTIPPEYRLKPALDKDGKPLLPKPDEKPKPLSDSELVDKFSKEFVCPAAPAAQSKPTNPTNASATPVVSTPAKTPEVSTPAKTPAVSTPAKTTKEEVPRAAMRTVQSSAPSATTSVGHVPDEAVEALSGSLGKREPDPEESKPAVDKVKEKAKEEEREKLGEDEETIPPDYRLTEVKDKDGKPLMPKPQEKPKPMSESDLLDALSEGFSCSAATTVQSAPITTSKEAMEVKKSSAAPTEDAVSFTAASAVHSAAPPPAPQGGKELDKALDLLSDSLGQREPDPDENKPIVDKVKEKATSEHIDKPGERDDTIPPEYRELLDSNEQGKPVKPMSKEDVEPKEPKKPADDSAAIDALSGDFDACSKPPAKLQHSECRTKVERNLRPRKPPQKMTGNLEIPKRRRSSPPAENLRDKKQAKR